jgi:alcohol dehydrogenase class IV
MDFTYHMPTKVVFGCGALDKLSDAVKEAGAVRVLVVTGRGSMMKTGVLDRVLSLLSAFDVDIFKGVESDPSTDTVDEVASKAVDADALIGLGGGSVLDATKAASVVAGNGGKASEYLSGGKTLWGGPKIIAVPTTSGTGSEVTEVSVLSEGEGVTKSFRSRFMYTTVALDDPELTKTMPKGITASSGLDALTHAVEALVSKKSQPIGDVLCMEAAKLVFDNLEKAHANPDDMAARENMMLASLMAGYGITHAGAGLAHGLSYGLHRVADMPHGLACGLLLPHVIRYNMGADGGKYEALASHCGLKSTEDLITRVEELKKALNVPDRLGDAGLTEDDVKAVAEVSMTGSTRVNPRPIDDESLIKIVGELI